MHDFIVSNWAKMIPGKMEKEFNHFVASRNTRFIEFIEKLVDWTSDAAD